MTKVRETARVVCPGGPPKLRHRRIIMWRGTTRGDGVTVRIAAGVLATALALAGGDAGRLLLNPDGSVTVANSREHRDRLMGRRRG